MQNDRPDLRTVPFTIHEFSLDAHIHGTHWVRYKNEGDFMICPRGENCRGWACKETEKAFETL